MKKEKIDPKVYNEFILGLSLTSIKLLCSESKVEKNFNLPAKIKTTESKNFKNLEGGFFTVTHKYELQGTEEGKKKAGFHIKTIYELNYQSKHKMTKKIFEVFSEISLPLHTWPYFRQFVQEMTLRMALPPLTLNLLKYE